MRALGDHHRRLDQSPETGSDPFRGPRHRPGQHDQNTFPSIVGNVVASRVGNVAVGGVVLPRVLSRVVFERECPRVRDCVV
jgi:hypothetical protein